MKLISEKKALARLNELISDFKSEISSCFEFRAKSCVTCDVKGSCCLDAHFVNVHISRLEAVNIRRTLAELPEPIRSRTLIRIENCVDEYGLDEPGDSHSRTYACPLFDKYRGCLVHGVKPTACIVHACYAAKSDVPPGELQIEQERRIDDLSVRTYGKREMWLSLPVAITRK